MADGYSDAERIILLLFMPLIISNDIYTFILKLRKELFFKIPDNIFCHCNSERNAISISSENYNFSLIKQLKIKLLEMTESTHTLLCIVWSSIYFETPLQTLLVIGQAKFINKYEKNFNEEMLKRYRLDRHFSEYFEIQNFSIFKTCMKYEGLMWNTLTFVTCRLRE